MCARGSNRARVPGPSTSPLDATTGRSAKLKFIVILDAQNTLFFAPFVIAVAAMLSTVALGGVVLEALRSSGEQALCDELFGVPNRWLGTPDEHRLLRVKYFLPFWPLPPGADRLAPRVRATLFAARLAGFVFLCAILGFFLWVLGSAGV